MRVIVKVGGKCFLVPCGDGRKSVRWLITEALNRSRSFNTLNDVDPHNEDYHLCLPDGAIIWQDDAIEDVLENDGFVELKSKVTICSSNITYTTVEFCRFTCGLRVQLLQLCRGQEVRLVYSPCTFLLPTVSLRLKAFEVLDFQHIGRYFGQNDSQSSRSVEHVCQKRKQ